MLLQIDDENRVRTLTLNRPEALNAFNEALYDATAQALLDAADDPAAERAALNARQPIGRLVTADEVAHAICYLASPLSASTTGTVLAVDGGMLGLRLPP